MRPILLHIQSHNLHPDPDAVLQVASGDSSGMVCLWDLQTGQRQGHFTEAHGAARLTAMSFDHNQRRLLTAGSDGRVCMFNLNSGSLLQVSWQAHLEGL